MPWIYHTWIYAHVLNTLPFVWVVAVLVFGGNLVTPIVLWFILRGRPVLPQLQRQPSQGGSKKPRNGRKGRNGGNASRRSGQRPHASGE